MNTLLEIDQAIFHFFNDTIHNPVLDAIMPWWRDKETWFPLYALILLFSLIKFRWKGLLFVLAVGAATGLADLTSSKIMKPTFERVRPCNDEVFKEEVNLLVGCGKAYSFTSSHAANHFAMATFLALTLGFLYRWMRWPLYLWAATIALGQIYVGVHYPSDVLIGALIGWIIGNVVAKVYLRIPAISIVEMRNRKLEAGN